MWRLVIGAFDIDGAKGILSGAGVVSYSVSHTTIYFEYQDSTVADSVTNEIKSKYPVRVVKDFESLDELMEFLSKSYAT